METTFFLLFFAARFSETARFLPPFVSGLPFFSVFLSVSPPLFLSAGFFLLPLQITDIFLCLFLMPRLVEVSNCRCSFFYFLAELVRPVQTVGSRCHYFGRLCHFFCFPVFLCLWLFETWFPAWLSFWKTVGPPDYPAVHYKTQGIHQKGSDALPADSNQGYHCRWKCGHAENDDAGSQGQRQVENRDTDCQEEQCFLWHCGCQSSV